jgi:hypothetical protein
LRTLDADGDALDQAMPQHARIQPRISIRQCPGI